MRKIVDQGERETLADHLVAAFVSAVVMAITIALGPLMILFKAHSFGTGKSAIYLYSTYGTLHIWGTTLITLSFIIGLVVGPRRMAELWGHLWGTNEPPQVAVTLGFWLGIVAIIGITYFLAREHAL